MIFKPFYSFETGCPPYVFGCGSQDREGFVEELAVSPPKPEGMQAILRFDQGRL